MMSEEECYEALNGRMHCLIGYHNNDDWRNKLLSIVMQVYKEVEEFLIKFPSFFLAQRWKSTIISYLTNMDASPAPSNAIVPSPVESAVTLACATSSSNVTSV
jgi:hypothetical protein